MSRDDEIKKALENHRDVLDIVSEYFEGHVQERSQRFLKSLKLRRVASKGCMISKAIDYVEHYHKWIIEINDKRDNKVKIENNQMRYRVLMFIDQLLNEVPKSSLSKEIQQRIFLNICPSG